MFLEVVHCTQPRSDTEVYITSNFPSSPQISKDMQCWPGHETGRVMESRREHLLAGIWHLTTHGPEVLEAVPDGMDVGHSHKHDLTVRIVLCRPERKVEHANLSWKQPLKSSSHAQSSPGRTEHSSMAT